MLVFVLVVSSLNAKQFGHSVSSHYRSAFEPSLTLVLALNTSSFSASTIQWGRDVFGPDCLLLQSDDMLWWRESERIDYLRGYEKVFVETGSGGRTASLMMDISAEWQDAAYYSIARTCVVLLVLFCQACVSTARVRALFLLPIMRMLSFIDKHAGARPGLSEREMTEDETPHAGHGAGAKLFTTPHAASSVNLPSALSTAGDMIVPVMSPAASVVSSPLSADEKSCAQRSPAAPAAAAASTGVSAPSPAARDEIEMVENALVAMTRDNRELKRKLHRLKRVGSNVPGNRTTRRSSGGTLNVPGAASRPVEAAGGRAVVDLDAPITKVLASLNLLQSRLSATLSARDSSVFQDVIEKLTEGSFLLASCARMNPSHVCLLVQITCTHLG